MSSKYVTAGGIALINLIILYCEGCIPTNSTLDVLQFITARLVAHSIPKQQSRFVDTAHLRLEDFAAPLKVTNEPNKPWRQFLDLLWNLKSVDYLFELFNSTDLYFEDRSLDWETDSSVNPAVSKPCILHKSSVFGVFIRRCKADWERLNFREIDALWQSFLTFRSPSATPARLRGAAAEEDPGAFDLRTFSEGSGGIVEQILQRGIRNSRQHPSDVVASHLSSEHVEQLLEFQIEQMQKLGVRLPDEMRSKLMQAMESATLYTNISHYARFLDAWYAGDYASSFESLHRYYDYALHAKDRSQYQYALLNMSILQADFGCYHESLAAINEAISASRDNKDMPCLNFALSWLHHFRNVYRRQLETSIQHALFGTDVEALAFLKAKSIENKMWTVMSTTLLDEARSYLKKGHQPRGAITRIVEASELINRYSLTSVESALHLMAASVYSRLGVNTLCRAYCSLLNMCYKQDTLIADRVRAKGLLAYCHALAGETRESQTIIDSLSGQTHQTLKLHQLVTSYTKLHQLRLSVLADKPEATEPLLRSLLSLANTDPEIRFTASVLGLTHAAHRNNNASIFTDIEAMFDETARTEADVYHSIRLLSLKARHFAKVGLPQKGFTLAMRAVAAALTAKILPALWEAVSVLAGVLVSIESYAEAEELAMSVVFMATEAEDLAIIAGLWMVAAEACVGLAKSTEHNARHMMLHLRRGFEYLERADTLFTKLGDIHAIAEAIEKQVLLLVLLGESQDLIEAREQRVSGLLAGKS